MEERNSLHGKDKVLPHHQWAENHCVMREAKSCPSQRLLKPWMEFKKLNLCTE